MSYNISKTLVNKLPKDERDEPATIGKFLFDRQSGKCWLCAGAMNLAAEILEADHDQPQGEGGETKLSNLHLTHLECNRSKKNLSTSQVQPFLRLRRYIREKSGRLKYGDLTSHFDIKPAPSKVDQDQAQGMVTFQFPDSSTRTSPIVAEATGDKEWRYVFVEVPQTAIFNDEHVQPRNVRYDHAFMIYGDLLKNPLHEPPSCRLGAADADGLQPLLMFDGQHKTIATWMMGRKSVAVKLYLNMSVQEANFLVNSIQSKIKKLPLSAFELASKMSDEWRSKVEEYESEMLKLNKTGSEDGYLKWIPSGPERNRAKSAFKAALTQQALDHSNFRIRQSVAALGAPSSSSDLTETMVKTKILDKMIAFQPMADPFYESTSRRDEETENIVWLWNLVVDELVFPQEGEEATDEQIEARRRLFKQASLEHISQLLVQLFRHHMMRGDDLMLDGIPTQAQRELIEVGVKRICQHPVWTASLDRDAKMIAVEDALSRNQGGKTAFERVALKLSYILIGHADIEYKAYWMG